MSSAHWALAAAYKYLHASAGTFCSVFISRRRFYIDFSTYAFGRDNRVRMRLGNRSPLPCI